MRVIAGTAKGRKLRAPQGFGTRPMTDRAREGLFSSLAAIVAEARVVDLYAGSGTLGLEALSRGADEATFVENDPKAMAALRANIEAVGLGGSTIKGDVMSFLSRRTGTFDLAFVDPPYALPLPSVDEVLERLADHLGEDATVILHRRRGGGPPQVPEGLALVDRRAYGDSELFRYAKEDS